MKISSWIGFLAIILSLLPTPTFADCLEFHVIENEPLGYANRGTPARGVHWEYLQAIETESGLCINKTLMPYARIWQSIERGEHDGGIVFSSPIRKHLVHLVAPIRKVNTIVVANKGKPIKEYNDIRHLVIGKTRGVHLSDKFDQDTNLVVVELNNYEQAALMLEKNRIDAVAGSSLVLSYQLFVSGVGETLDYNNKVILGSRTQYLQMSKKSKHQEKLPLLKTAVETLKANGTFDAIMDKYYGPKWRQING